MSSYRQIYYHIVFGTKYRKHTIPYDHCDDLYRYMAGIIKNNNCKPFQINGSTDHIHILSDLHPSVSLADYIKSIKVGSSIWLKTQLAFNKFTGWADKYAAFTVSHQDRERIIVYIKRQKEHHKKIDFLDELQTLLREHGIEFDERYLLRLFNPFRVGFLSWRITGLGPALLMFKPFGLRRSFRIEFPDYKALFKSLCIII